MIAKRFTYGVTTWDILVIRWRNVWNCGLKSQLDTGKHNLLHKSFYLNIRYVFRSSLRWHLCRWNSEVVGAYSNEAKKLGSIILELIAEGLGLESGYFRNQLSESSVLSINHYPPCPNPSLTLGLVKHCDPNLITILLQGDVCGLQVLKDGEWIGVEPLPNAFVINIGYILQVIAF